MNDYPLEPGQLMIVRANNFGHYADWSHKIVCLHKVTSSENGTIAICYYTKNQKQTAVSIPLFLLWRIADDEDLLEMHENYIHSKNLNKLNEQISKLGTPGE